jgi:hypothetical protein
MLKQLCIIKNIFQNTIGETFTFLACDVHIETCSSHLKLSNLPFQTVGLHYKILAKKKMLVELCVGNYETFDGLVNGANVIFENFIKLFQNLLFEYIFIILRSDIIHELKIYKSMTNSQGLTNNGHQLNVKLSKYK